MFFLARIPVTYIYNLHLRFQGDFGVGNRKLEVGLVQCIVNVKTLSLVWSVKFMCAMDNLLIVFILVLRR